MDSSVQNQIWMFLITLGCGISIGAIYDFYRLFRYYSRPKRIKTFIQDLIFWLLLSAIIILVVDLINDGELRGFIFVGFTLGIIMYSRLLSKKLIKVITYVIDALIYKFRRLIQVMGSPFREIKCRVTNKLRTIKKYLNIPRLVYDNTLKSVATILKKK